MSINHESDYVFVRAFRPAKSSLELSQFLGDVWDIADDVFGSDSAVLPILAPEKGNRNSAQVTETKLRVSSSYVFKPSEITSVLFERRASPDTEEAQLFIRFAERMGSRHLPGGRRVRRSSGKVERAGRLNPLPLQLRDIGAACRKGGKFVLNAKSLVMAGSSSLGGYRDYAFQVESSEAIVALAEQRRHITDISCRLRNFHQIAELSDVCQGRVDSLTLARIPDATELQHDEFLSRVTSELIFPEIELDHVNWGTGSL